MSDRQQPKSGRNKLRGKEPELVKALTTTANVSKAGRMAGYGTYQSAHRAFHNIQKKVPDLMDEIGMTDEFLLRKCLEGLSVNEIRHFHNKGIVMETKEVPAIGERRAYLDMAFKLKGSYAQERVGLDVIHTHTLDFANASEKEIDAILKLCAPYVSQLPESASAEIHREPIDMAVRQ